MEKNDNNIPAGWHKVAIGDCIVERKKSPIKVDDVAGFGNYPFFTSGEGILQHDRKLVEGENIYLSTGGNAVVKYYNGNAAYSTDTFVVTCKEHHHTKFFYYTIDYLIDYINANYFQGSGLKHLQKKSLKQHEILVPADYEEQRRIADALTQIDDAIATKRRLIVKHEQVKRGMMHDLLTRGIDSNGNIRSEETHRFKDSPIGRIPVEWEVVGFSDLAGSIKDYIKTGPFGSSLKGEHWRETGTPVITIGSIGENEFITENLLYVDDSKAYEMSPYALKAGDILFSRVADIGRSLIIDTEHEGWIMSSNFMRLRIDSSLMNSRIINLVIRYSGDFKRQVQEKVNSSGRSVSNTKILNSFLVPYMSTNEQANILALYDQLNDSICSLEKEADNLTLTRQGLLSDLITGKTRI